MSISSNKKIRKVSIHAVLSRALRKALGGVTQAELAAKLLVSRNYISQIEASLKTPSDRLEIQMRQMLTAAADEVSNEMGPGTEDLRPPDGVDRRAFELLGKSLPKLPETAAEMRADVRAKLDQLLSMAGNDVGRIGWLREELDWFARRVQWRVSPEERQAALIKLHQIKQQVAKDQGGKVGAAQNHG